ncbi:hypothetical protein HanIR_Chr02g0085651 [Helianthus annuus]|nr:hypothetical protein HanIR_Chr02g0085651 [Helianthus annuus]
MGENWCLDAAGSKGWKGDVGWLLMVASEVVVMLRVKVRRCGVVMVMLRVVEVMVGGGER